MKSWPITRTAHSAQYSFILTTELEDINATIPARMYSLHLFCTEEQVDILVAELSDAGTIGIREEPRGELTELIAGFETNGRRAELLAQFADYRCEWVAETSIDWVQQFKDSWPGRSVGTRFFVTTPWCEEPTPSGRIRLVQNPAGACGTGEHECTQLALAVLEKIVRIGQTVADVGTGSGILTIAALKLGCRAAVGVDLDEAALQTAKENFALNDLALRIVVGSADCLKTESADITIANISGTVILSILDDLIRITRPDGLLILTGFLVPEAEIFGKLLEIRERLQLNEWSCVVAAPRLL